jgi:hypothetical protein
MRALLLGVTEKTQHPYRTKNNPVARGGRSPEGKMRIIAAVEEAIDSAPSRLHLGLIADAAFSSLHPFIKANITLGTARETDGWSACPGVPSCRFEPYLVDKMAAHIVPPCVHRVISNLKTRAFGAYHDFGASSEGLVARAAQHQHAGSAGEPCKGARASSINCRLRPLRTSARLNDNCAFPELPR